MPPAVVIPRVNQAASNLPSWNSAPPTTPPRVNPPILQPGAEPLENENQTPQRRATSGTVIPGSTPRTPPRSTRHDRPAPAATPPNAVVASAATSTRAAVAKPLCTRVRCIVGSREKLLTCAYRQAAAC